MLFYIYFSSCEIFYCKKCAMKLASGGKCKKCGKFYANMRRIQEQAQTYDEEEESET